MMRELIPILFLICFLLASAAYSQEIRNDEIIVEQGKKVIVHTVRTGETLFSISKKFNTEINELEFLNPGIKKGIQIGQQIRIPYTSVDFNENDKVQKKAPTDFVIHKIESKTETLYSISKKYNVKIEDINQYNPNIKVFKKGTKIKIPVWKEDEPEKQKVIVEDVKPKTGPKENKPALFLDHIIGSGETMYGLTKKYNVSEEELIEINPELKEKFPAGMIIRVPVKEIPVLKAVPVNSMAFKKHDVLKGETLFGLADYYNIEINEIVKYNENLEKRGLIEGETILIPQRPSQSVNRFIPGDKEDSIKFFNEYYKLDRIKPNKKGCEISSNRHFVSKTCEIALLLPLFINENVTVKKNPGNSETDTEEDSEKNEGSAKSNKNSFFNESENFLQFYEGVLVAIDQLQNEGMKIKLNVFDTRNSLTSITKILSSPDFDKNKLIIGPVTHELQSDVSEFSKKNNIPIVSPLASASQLVKTNPWYFQINPDKEYIAEKTAEIIVFNHFRNNIIILSSENKTDSPEKRISELIQEKIATLSYTNKVSGVKANVINYNSGQLQSSLSKQKENVIFIESSNEGTVGTLLQKLKNLAAEYPITLIAPNHRFMQQYPSVETEFFHQLKLEYIAPYWIDYKNPLIQNFYGKFRENFATDPSNYGIQGYDIAYYFLTALNLFGEDFRECLPTLDINLIQGTYSFEKVSKSGGYKNEGVSVVALDKDYNINRKRILGINK